MRLLRVLTKYMYLCSVDFVGPLFLTVPMMISLPSLQPNHKRKMQLLSINETRLDFEGQTFHEDFKGQSKETQNCLLNNLSICQLKTNDTSLCAPYSASHFSCYCH